MPKISEKGTRMPASPIRKLVPFAEAAKKRGTHVIHLNIGQPDIETPIAAREAVRNLDVELYEYSHSAGMECYREKMTEYYKRIGIDLTVNDIITTEGGSEAIIMAMTVCCNSGDEILIPEPFYANYNGFAVQTGVTIVPVKSSIDNDFALPPIEEFEQLITPRTKAILICNPNNPTGYLYSKEELEVLRKLVLKHDLYLFSDEVYREFCYDGAQHTSVLSLEGLENNAILFDSVSKRYSMCGVRLGALISRNKDVISAALKLAQARLSPPFIAQVAATAAIDTPDEYFTRVHKEYTERRNCLVNALNKIDGVYCPMPKGAFYVIVKLPVDDSDKFAQWILEEFSHNGKTVMMAPATGFYSTPGLGRNEVRMAYVLRKDELLDAVECLEKALQEYPGRTI